MGNQLGQFNGRPAGKWMIRRQEGNRRYRPHDLTVELAREADVIGNHDIRKTLRQVRRQFRETAFPRLESHHREPGLKSFHGGDQVPGCNVLKAPDDEGAGLIRSLFDPVGPFQQVTRLFDDTMPIGGDPNRRPFAPHKQQRAKTLFHARDGNRKRRLRHVQTLCRTRQAASFGNGDDVLILSKADV